MLFRSMKSHNDDGWHSMKTDNDEEGSIEAGMTLIPTTVFFLLALQLVVAGTFKTVETINLQSWINRNALYSIDGTPQDGLESSGQSFSSGPSIDGQSRKFRSLQLPGGGELLLAQSMSKTPVITSFAMPIANSGGLMMKSEAIAIRE